MTRVMVVRMDAFPSTFIVLAKLPRYANTFLVDPTELSLRLGLKANWHLLPIGDNGSLITGRAGLLFWKLTLTIIC